MKSLKGGHQYTSTPVHHLEMEEWEEEWEIGGENEMEISNGSQRRCLFFQEFFFEFQLENREEGAQRVRKCLAEAYCSCRRRVARHGT